MPQKRDKTLRICKNGHPYYKSTDCPTCPECEKAKKPKAYFLAELSAPARRALENSGIDSLEKLAGFSEKKILALHGIGPSSIPVLRKLLKKNNLHFQKN